MNRRELIKRAAMASVAAGIPASVALAEDAVGAKEDRSVGASKERDAPESSLSPGSGSLPAAFVLGPRAEVLDFCGPLEVFAGASTSDGKDETPSRLATLRGIPAAPTSCRSRRRPHASEGRDHWIR